MVFSAAGTMALVTAVQPPWATMASRRNGHGSNGESFGGRLARLRKQAGYSQRSFSEEIGISHRMVAYYEAQTDRPPAQLLPAIARALGVTTDQLLGLDPISRRKPPLNRRLLRQLRKIETLPARDQQALLRTIDAFINGVRTESERG